jgi:hypothetical protein
LNQLLLNRYTAGKTRAVAVRLDVEKLGRQIEILLVTLLLTPIHKSNYLK